MAKDYSRIKKLSEHEENHSFLAESLLVPNCNKTDCNRLTMFISELAQAVVLNEADIPLVQSGFEAQVGEYTIDGYQKLEGTYTVLAKIPKNKMNYLLLVRNDDTGIISFVKRSECSHFTEHYGCKYDNEVIDNKYPGDKINNEILYRSNSYDNDGNFMYGRNMKTCYMTYKNLTYEDPIVISESAAKKLSYSNVYKVKISVNDNDLLLNIYGGESDEEDDLFTTKETYKAFPDIGEYVNERGILAVRRRIAYNKMLKNLKNEKLKEIEPDDTSFYIHGQVVDINVYSNMTEEVLSAQRYNNQVYDLVVEDKKYRKGIVDKVEEYRKTYGDESIHPELIALYNQCKQVIENESKDDESKRNMWVYESNEFKGYILEFTILEYFPLTVGSKLANRYGGKGVVSRILPDDEMPIIESGPFKGERPELIQNSLGVLNRLIPSIGGNIQ